MTDWVDLLALRSLQLFSSFVQSLSLPAALRVGRIMGRIAFYFSGRRHYAYADMKAALGPALNEKERWRTVRDSYVQFGQVVIELLYFPKIDKAMAERIMRAEFLEKNDSAFQGEWGRMVLTAHFGNWEMMAALPPRYSGRPMVVLARIQKFPRLNQYLNSLRESLGSTVVSRGMELRIILRSLRRNEWVGILGDQDAGRHNGLILPFLGRKTTVPTGPYEFSARTGAAIVPAFMVRQKNAPHTFFVGRSINCRPDFPEDIEMAARYYISMLEEFIRKYPSHWLWGTKRWKFCWTKRILILSDGKPGHVKQSQTIAEQIRTHTTQYERPGMEYPTTLIDVKFKSEWHRKLFPWFAFILMPWVQGRLRYFKFFFKPETAKAIEEASADFIISAGSSLVPLNISLARDNCAKSVVLMKPPFPFNLFHIELNIVPAHDRGMISADSFRTLLAPSGLDKEALQSDAGKFGKTLRDASKVRYSIFLGGDTRNFKMKINDIQRLFEEMENITEAGDYLVTTSRRTSDEITVFLKNQIRHKKRCQAVIVAKEDTRPEVVGGMMALADILIVTEDSISMISEALRSGKKVVVLTFDSRGLPTKHRRFREILARESAIVITKPEKLKETLEAVRHKQPADIAQIETEALRKRLQEIL
jgi:Kdo2-lipid IVA lauroyltransferase/acyltransferase